MKDRIKQHIKRLSKEDRNDLKKMTAIGCYPHCRECPLSKRIQNDSLCNILDPEAFLQARVKILAKTILEVVPESCICKK